MLQIFEVTKEDEGVYRCVASNSAGRGISHEARLVVTTGEFSHSALCRENRTWSCSFSTTTVVVDRGPTVSVLLGSVLEENNV